MNEDDPKPNLEPLRLALKQIDDHPETYYQQAYGKRSSCGTAYCVGGHVVTMAGQKLYFDHCGIAYCTESRELVSDAAMEILGITCDEAVQLFDPGNSREDVQRAAEQIAARAGEKL